MRKHDVVYANFICKFGEFPLLKYLEEIVLPAFLNDAFYRKRGQTHYYLIKTEFKNLGTQNVPDFCIFGRFVKDTVLKRYQTYDEERGEIKVDEQAMETAPTAFFVLRLNGHRLIYFAETPYAPTVGEFQATLRKHLSLAYERYVRSLKNTNGGTLKSIREQIQHPTLNVNTMVGEDNLRDFVRRFERITRLEIEVHERNEEQDAFELVEAIEAHRAMLDGDKSKLVTTSKEGLDADSLIDAVSGAGRSGNQTTRVKGFDEDGGTIDGSQNDFAVRDRMPLPPAVDRTLASRLRELFVAAVAADRIEEGPVSDDTVETIKRVADQDGEEQV